MTNPRIDYRDLLRRYIHHVGYYEGFTYISYAGEGDFSQEEIEEMERLEEMSENPHNEQVEAMTKDDGGSAFPTVDANRDEDYGTRGLTKREYFAAQALVGMLSRDYPVPPTMEQLALWSFQQADAMIAAGNLVDKK
jgi:hypothetical protein